VKKEWEKREKETGRRNEREGEGERERQEEKRVTLSFLFPSFRASYGHHPFPPPPPAPFFKYSTQEKQPLARVFAFRAKLLLRPVNSLPPFQPPRASSERRMTEE